jgi:Uma2 family endonuclease
MSTARKFEPVSVADYLAGEKTAKRKHEYVGGEVYAIAGASNTHNRVASNVTGLLHSQLRGNPCDVFNSDTKVRVRAQTGMRFFYPDAMVVCNANPSDDHFQDNPVLIVEVVSQSTRRIDMGEKRESYLQIPSLDTYIILEQSTLAAIVFQRNENGEFHRQSYTDGNDTVPLPTINCKLNLSEVYENVEFVEEPEVE